MKIKHIHYTEVKPEIPKEDGVKDTTIRWLITRDDGAKNFAMRLFEVKPNGYTPWHRHDWEHESFILDGEGILVTDKGNIKLSPGDVLFIPPMEWHQFKNAGDKNMKFLCLIPYKE